MLGHPPPRPRVNSYLFPLPYISNHSVYATSLSPATPTNFCPVISPAHEYRPHLLSLPPIPPPPLDQVNCCSKWHCNSPIADFYDRRLESLAVLGFWDGYTLESEAQMSALTTVSVIVGVMLAALTLALRQRNVQTVFVKEVESMLNESAVFRRRDQATSVQSRLDRSSMMFNRSRQTLAAATTHPSVVHTSVVQPTAVQPTVAQSFPDHSMF